MTDSNSLSNRGAGEPSSSLLNRIREYDQIAWERLVSLYSPLIYRWCRLAGLQPADAADVGQQVFLAVARQVCGFSRDRGAGSFRAWLRTLTRYSVCDHYRAMQTKEEKTEGANALERLEKIAAEELAKTDPAAERDEESLLFHRAITLMQAEFAETTWQAFWQVVVDGRSASDVSRDLGMSANAVYLARGRVLRRLREEFSDLMDM